MKLSYECQLPMGANFDMRIRLSDGCHLGYAEYGDPDGKPVVYFHGGLSSRLDIAFAALFCQTRGIRLLSIDRPGIGLSDFQPNRMLLDWPDDICEHLMRRVKAP